MDLQQLELHDAQLLSVHFDPVALSVELRLALYPTEQSKDRIYGSIRFEAVSQFNQLADLAELTQNFRAGNIGYWVPEVGPGTTYIYLVRGLISVTAASVSFVADA
jgi:hypothetical protein